MFQLLELVTILWKLKSIVPLLLEIFSGIIHSINLMCEFHISHL